MIFEKHIVNVFKGMMHTRCDDTETVFYFSYKDFEGLQGEVYSFKSSQGHTLHGYIRFVKFLSIGLSLFRTISRFVRAGFCAI